MIARLDQGRLDEIRARLAAITPGPWSIGLGITVLRLNAAKIGLATLPNEHMSDAEFIAAAPQDVADLLTEVEALRERLTPPDERVNVGYVIDVLRGAAADETDTLIDAAILIEHAYGLAAPVAGGTS